MSQNWQQPPQQPQQPGGYGNPPQQPQYGGQPPYGGQPQYGGGFPPPPPPAPQGNAGVALLVGLIAAIVGAAIYAGILFGLADTDKGEVTKVAYASVGVGALVGFAVAKLGGRNQGLWIVGAVLALAATFIGELYGFALFASEMGEKAASSYPGYSTPSANEIFFENFSDLFEAWKEELEGWEWLFIALAPVASFATSHRIANSR